jgi:hypothetical protein
MDKMDNNIAGLGRKRPQLNVSINNLHLDPQNPRLPIEAQGKGQDEIIYSLWKFFDTEELGLSISKNGYFDEEPLVAIPENLPEEFKDLSSEQLQKNENYKTFINKPETQFIVVEGNRRLATIITLLSNSLQTKLGIRGFPSITEKITEEISILPVIVYPNRNEVLPYLGVRHISGIKKWDPYAKARYVAYMIDGGKSIDEVQEIVADRSNSARKFYLCYKLVQQVDNEFGFDTSLARDEFSYLLLASGQSAIKEFLGLPTNLASTNFEQPVPTDKVENLKYLFSWLYGEGTEVSRVLKESRDITNYLSPVIKSPLALEYLKETRELKDAYDRSGGEEKLLISYLKKANSNLGKSMPFISKNKNSEELISALKNIEDSLETINKIIKD